MTKLTRKILASLLLLTLFCSIAPLTAYAQTDITAAFTDANFLAEVYRTIGKTAPEPIFDTDVEKITTLSVGGKNIQNLAGVAYFTALTRLQCSHNQLTELPALPSGVKYLFCDYNQLTGVNLLGLQLAFFDGRYNNIECLDDFRNVSYRGGTAYFLPQSIPVRPYARDVTALRNQLEIAKNTKRGVFTLGKDWQNLQTAIAEAQQVLDNEFAATEQLYEQKDNLANAVKIVEHRTFFTAISDFFNWFFGGLFRRKFQSPPSYLL